MPKNLPSKRPPIWKNPRRLLRYYRLRLMRIQAPPRSIALGLAIGVLVGLLPIVPLHTVSALGLAVLFRGSKAAALLGTLVSNPLDFVPHYLLLYYIGHALWPLAIPPLNPHKLHLQDLLADGWELLAVMMVGGLVLALPSALLTYWLTFKLLTRYRAAGKK